MNKYLLSAMLIASLSACTTAQQGADEADFHQWAQMPPMGWNSFDCYGSNVVEDEVKANADYMARNLKKYGWEYVVVDIRWYDVWHDNSHAYNVLPATYTMDEYGRLLPDTLRFPLAAGGMGFKPLADYIHGKGLKFGIHIMRGIPREAVAQNTPIKGSTAKAADVYSEENLCTWLGDMYTLDSTKEGAQEYYNSIFDLYASWGLDFVKVDDLSFPYHKDEIEMIRKAIDQCGRHIVFSTSPGDTPIDQAGHVKDNANMWRVIGDLWDRWEQEKYLFGLCEQWAPYAGEGHFPDCDMLPLGRLGIRAEMGEDRASNFTPEEQRTLMTLFAIARSPMMFGGDLPSMDPATLKLITNKEVLNVNQHSANGRQLFRQDDLIAWAADDPQTGDKYVAFFNAQDQVPVILDKAMWNSEVLSAAEGKLSVKADFDIPETLKLYLYVSDAGNGSFYDHADWIEPTLSGPKGTLKLTSLPWANATAGWGTPLLGKSIDEAPLSVDGKQYADGIGTHANSMIEFDIPEGYNRFSAIMGLDDDCIEHIDGASVQFFIFTEDPAGEKPADSSAFVVDLAQLGMNGDCYVTDLWTGKSLGKFKGSFSADIKLHDAGLYRISKKNK